MGDDINAIDREIIELISKRSELYIKRLKERNDDNRVFFPEDRTSIEELINEANNGPLHGNVLKRIFTEIISGSMATLTALRVAFLGPEGTFTHIALQEVFGKSIEPLPQRTIQDVFKEVETGNAQYGVVPVENSTEGAVTYTLDELIETDLKIISEKYVRISYNLLSNCNDIRSVKRVYTHPQSLGQCKNWLRINLPDAEITTVDSTSKAAELAAEDKDSAALSSAAAAEIYDIKVLASRIEDLRQNYTRFFVIGRYENKPSGCDKTSIVCAVKDKPGALLEILKPLSKSGINMTKIESRPDKKKMWEYNFFIDFQGHRNDRVIKDALEKIGNDTIFLKILGSYPTGN